MAPQKSVLQRAAPWVVRANHSCHRPSLLGNFAQTSCRAQAAAALVGAYQVWEKSAAAPAHPPAAPAESFSADEQDRINRKVRADLRSPPAKR